MTAGLRLDTAIPPLDDFALAAIRCFHLGDFAVWLRSDHANRRLLEFRGSMRCGQAIVELSQGAE